MHKVGEVIRSERIRLPCGLQKSLIEQAKSRTSRGWEGVGRRLAVSEHVVKFQWRSESNKSEAARLRDDFMRDLATDM